MVLQEHNKMAVAEKNSVASSSKSPIGKRCSQLVRDSACAVVWTIIKVAEAC